MNDSLDIPRFFRLRQTFARPRISSYPEAVRQAIIQSKLANRIHPGQSVAITAGSRGINQIAEILHHIVREVRALGGLPFVVPAMGSHGGGTVEGQLGVLAALGVTPKSLDCEIRASMETVEVCQAKEGFPVHFDAYAYAADHVIVVNRVKPHTRFYGSAESGLMKMMLIGLGKHAGALVYHRVIQNYTFDQIVRSVAREVIARCSIAAGIAILENAYDDTADIVGVEPQAIETVEPQVLLRVRELLPRLPFDRADLLIVDEIGKEYSGTGMDTNIVGRKSNERAALGDEVPKIVHIYVRALSEGTQGNASGIGLAELCHRRVLDQMDHEKTRINCITAAHIAGAAIPVDFPSDQAAVRTAVKMGGWGEVKDYAAMWIPNTLHIDEVECSEVYLKMVADHPHLEILREPTPLQFDAHGNLPSFQARGAAGGA